MYIIEASNHVIIQREEGREIGGGGWRWLAHGVSGLGLVRALLPRRTATLTLTQLGVQVEAKVVLVPPSITLLEPL